jgi:hypothetical protein
MKGVIMNAVLPRNEATEDNFNDRNNMNPPMPANNKWRS